MPAPRRLEPSERSERGASAVLVAMLSIGLMGALAFVTDFGFAYANERRLQNGADAAALAVGRKIAATAPAGASCAVLETTFEASAQTRADASAVFASNVGGGASLDSGSSGFDLSCEPQHNGLLTVTVVGRQDSPTFLGGIFGEDEITVVQRSRVLVGALGSAVGLRPFAICASVAANVRNNPGSTFVVEVTNQFSSGGSGSTPTPGTPATSTPTASPTPAPSPPASSTATPSAPGNPGQPGNPGKPANASMGGLGAGGGARAAVALTNATVLDVSYTGSMSNGNGGGTSGGGGGGGGGTSGGGGGNSGGGGGGNSGGGGGGTSGGGNSGSGTCGAAAGNWSLLDFDGGNNSQVDTRKWIEKGYEKPLDLTTDPSIPGNPGLGVNSASTELDVMFSERDVVLPVYSPLSGNGANATYRITGFLSVTPCHYRINNQSGPGSANTGCPALDFQDATLPDDFIHLKFSAFIPIGSLNLDCSLGDVTCDEGIRTATLAD